MNTVSAIPDELIPRLLDGAFTREEQAAIKVIVNLEHAITRPDFLERFVRDLEDGDDELVIDWAALAEAEEHLPLSSGELVMVQLALSLVGVKPFRLDRLMLVDTRNVETALDAITFVATGRWAR